MKNIIVIAAVVFLLVLGMGLFLSYLTKTTTSFRPTPKEEMVFNKEMRKKQSEIAKETEEKRKRLMEEMKDRTKRLRQDQRFLRQF